MASLTDDPLQQTRMVLRLLERTKLFPHPAGDPVHIETHISHLLLAGEYAYKIKKPLNLGFLDFSTLERRRRCCEEELRLNRRLAPALYLEVVALSGTPEQPDFQGTGAALEYAVKMRRFRQEELLGNRLPSRDEIDRLADLVADFHQEIPPVAPQLPYGTPRAVLQPMEENFQQIRALKRPLLEVERLNRLRSWTEDFAASSRGLLEERRLGGRVRECHGDLHLGNITRFEGRLTPFDGIEFNPALRWIDTLSDLAFLLMDLQSRDLSPQSAQLLNRYLERTGDYHGLPLLRFYLLYRALVRAKVSAIRASQEGLERESVPQALEDYRRYLGLAESVIRQPPAALLITHGLSGSGKSHISGWLAEQLMAIRIRSDVERRRLYPDTDQAGSPAHPQRYTPRATEVTYAHLEAMARQLLQAGFSVIVDATFLKRRQRQGFVELAASLQTPILIIDCRAPDGVLSARIGRRAAVGGDASEAGQEVLVMQRQGQEPFTGKELDHVIAIDSEGFPPRGLLASVVQRLMG